MEHLKKLGWDDRRETEYQNFGADAGEPGRVAAADRGQCVVLTGDGEVQAKASGKLLHESSSALGIPAVGDWVVFRNEGDSAVIERVMPRTSCLLRKTSGREYQAQVIAANIDKIFIVTAVGRDLNPRRIERHLAAAHSAGAEPVVVINKRDLPHDRDEIMDGLNLVTLTTKVIMTSTLTDNGLDEMDVLLKTGETIALIGSSGVGKSSLVNKLIGYERQQTISTRESDGKGRHTTTRRELIITPAGFMVIDTPGMREFGLWDAEEGLAETFSDIMELASLCKFRDCTHTTEPKCAVREADKKGLLPPGRVDSYLRLVNEQHNTEKWAQERDGKETKRRWKDISKEIRRRNSLHEKLGLKNK
jgi:ribosome biogenesis GTPase / thiamine phosphate phosphatase